MAIQDEILRQLAEIQRSLGEVVATVEALREDAKNSSNDSEAYRNQVGAALSNTVTRLGNVENDIKEVKTTMEKTIKPLIINHTNWQQRVIGFTAAVSMFGFFLAGIWWLFTVGGPAIMKYLSVKFP